MGVLVVGAGPTGLLLAAELQRRGVPCELIDALPAPHHWDRATVVHPRSSSSSSRWGSREGSSTPGRRSAAPRSIPTATCSARSTSRTAGAATPFSLGVSEEVTESILTDYLHDQGGEVTRSSRLVGLTHTPTASSPRSSATATAPRSRPRWVVGCDGLHSPTREASGIGFEGHDIAAPWAVFDATLQGWTEVVRPHVRLPRRHPGHPHRASRPALARLPAAELAGVGSRRRRRGDAPAATTPPRRLSTSRTRPASTATRRSPTQFRSGPVLLAGDAAHLCSPAQGHGMNTGVQDAANLAWKLALVHQGVADPALLDSYEVERRPVAADRRRGRRRVRARADADRPGRTRPTATRPCGPCSPNRWRDTTRRWPRPS